jgi:hypothetical protein
MTRRLSVKPSWPGAFVGFAFTAAAIARTFLRAYATRGTRHTK